MAPNIKLTYFDTEGTAEPVRLALLLSKTPFEDVRVAFGPDWPVLKATLPNGQLPVMTIDDGPMRAQSKAMLRWIGATFSETLYPRDKLFDIEEAIGFVEDLTNRFQLGTFLSLYPGRFGYPSNFPATDEGKAKMKEMREQFMSESFPSFMTRMTNMLEAHGGGPFLVAGNKPTIADCLAVSAVRVFTRGFIDYIDPNCLDGYPVIVKYVKNFCSLDEVKGRYNVGLF